MTHELGNRKIAILAPHGVEQSEVVEPRTALERAGARVDLISPEPGRIQAFNRLDRGDTFAVHRTAADVGAPDYDGLILPGGIVSPDALRTDPSAVQFVRGFLAAGKPVAAICHGPWLLVEADAVRHRTVTSRPSLRTDIANAGGAWVDEAVHVDGWLVTSRSPDDLCAFCTKLLEVFAAGSQTAGPERTQAADVHDLWPGDGTVAIDVASADSFPASDPPSSLRVT